MGCRNNRLKKMASHDRQVVAYDAHMDSIPCIYFPGITVVHVINLSTQTWCLNVYYFFLHDGQRRVQEIIVKNTGY